MKKFIIKISFFLAPFLMALGLELFVLPLDFFNFRVWEAVVVYKFGDFFAGPFYPNQTIHKMEEGDLAFNSAYAKKKDVIWFTDEFGFRFDPKKNPRARFDVVVVGDSHVVGNSLSEDNRITEVLSRKIGRRVYPYATRTLNEFFNDPRFKLNPPRVLVFARAENYFLKSFGPLNLKERTSPDYSPFIQQLIVVVDRLYRANMIHYLQNRLRSNLAKWVAGMRGEKYDGLKWFTILGTNKQMVFDRDMTASVYNPVSDEEISKVVEEIIAYKKESERRGIFFVFFPIPIKSTVYYELIPRDKPSLFLKRLIHRAQQNGINTIDSWEAFVQNLPSERGYLYQDDDTHWTGVGADYAAGLVSKKIALIH